MWAALMLHVLAGYRVGFQKSLWLQRVHGVKGIESRGIIKHTERSKLGWLRDTAPRHIQKVSRSHIQPGGYQSWMVEFIVVITVERKSAVATN